MSKKKSNYNVTIIFANGVTMTDEEFMAQKVYIDPVLNADFYAEAQRVLNPAYAEQEKHRRRLERVEKRRAALAAEAERVHKELAEE